MILTSSWYFTAVISSHMSIDSPPSPITQTTGRSGQAMAAAFAYGNPQAMVARLPEQENIMFSRISM